MLNKDFTFRREKWLSNATTYHPKDVWRSVVHSEEEIERKGEKMEKG